LVDAATERKEFNDDEGGVGLARKIGMDTALQIFDYSIPGKKLIISLDADCLVEENYLSEISYFSRSKMFLQPLLTSNMIFQKMELTSLV